MKTLVINRDKWTRGNINQSVYGTELLNSDGCMCCLGFYMIQHTKATEECIFHRITPMGVASHGECKIGQTILLEDGNNSQFTCDALAINDDNTFPEKERESELTKLFKTKGYHVEFTGKEEK